jgi:hypothetical protein
MHRRIVILYGQAMLLSLVANSLRENPDLKVLQVSDWCEVEAYARTCIPDVLIYDLPGTSESNLLPLLSKNPHLLLIGLDTERNYGLLHTGKEAHSITMSQIRAIIEGGDT